MPQGSVASQCGQSVHPVWPRTAALNGTQFGTHDLAPNLARALTPAINECRADWHPFLPALTRAMPHCLTGTQFNLARIDRTPAMPR